MAGEITTLGLAMRRGIVKSGSAPSNSSLKLVNNSSYLILAGGGRLILAKG